MRNPTIALIAVSMLAGPVAARDVPAGSWRMTVEVGPGQAVVFLVAFESAGGIWSGKYLGSTDQLAADTRVEVVRVAPERVQFAIALRDQRLTFDGKPAGNRVPGTLLVDGQLLVTALEPSQLTAFDRFALAKEVFVTTERGPLHNQALQELLRQATARKTTADDVRTWVERAAKAAEPFGPRWQQGTALGVVAALDGQPAFAAVALAEARRAERLIDSADEALVQLEILEALGKALRAAGQVDEATALAPRVAQLEERDYHEASARPTLAVETFPGRKAQSDRVVLVEEFTGAELMGAVAPDIAFEALGRTYKHSEVVRLQYHLHASAGDALASPASEVRRKYYQLAQAPGLALNGKMALDGEGGSRSAAPVLWRQLKAVVDHLVEQPSAAKLQATATRVGEVVTVKASASGLPKPGDKLRLRLALVEDVVRYRGGNGLRFHPCVVRGFLGGEAGLPLTQPTAEFVQTLDLAELRKSLIASLDAFQKANPDAALPTRPLALKSLGVVAFVQDDATRDVLQAVRCDVR